MCTVFKLSFGSSLLTDPLTFVLDGKNPGNIYSAAMAVLVVALVSSTMLSVDYPPKGCCRPWV